MGSPLSSMEWIGKNERLDELLKQEETLTTHAMNQGFEAEVMMIRSGKESFVLKIWNKGAKPDIGSQFRLLNLLYDQGVSVSKPVGWGISPSGDKVLLTNYSGKPVGKLDETVMTEMATILLKIHQIRVDKIENMDLPKYDFLFYFFPGVRDHADLLQALTSLLQHTPIKQDCLIHGDFHLHNLVEDHGRRTVIDWTNGQLGDPRFDYAWSLTLMRIYISDRYAQVFRSAYLAENTIPQEELDVFEAIACLRWLLLNRSGGVPRNSRTMKKVKNLVLSNRFLAFCAVEIL